MVDSSSQEEEGKKKINEVKIFLVPFGLGEIKENISFTINTTSKESKEEKINKARRFHKQGNIHEATKCYQQLINEECNDHRVFSNYGTILMGLGKLKEAEISTRKAIKIKPDFAIAYSNLGTILISLGKSQELILLFKSKLKSISLNYEDKIMTSLQMTIANLIIGDFSETLLNINKTNELIKQGAINAIKNESNKKYSFNYYRLMASLYPLLKQENSIPTSEKIPHFGESHCLSFAHQNLSISAQIKIIQAVLIQGGKAQHFANKNNNQWKDSLNQQIKNHNYTDKVFISFGEIDCRKDEGILSYSIKKNKNILEICEKTITGYLDYMEKMLSLIYSEKYYFGVPAPTREKESLDELDIKRIKIIKLYNSILKKEVLSRCSYFLDVYALTSTKDGENNNLHMCDGTHLSPKCLSILFENYLYKS
jgi:tetratricopeptide (TPR) repeat protein